MERKRPTDALYYTAGALHCAADGVAYTDGGYVSGTRRYYKDMQTSTALAVAF